MSSSSSEPPGVRTRAISRTAAAGLGKWCGARRQVARSNAPALKGRASTSPARNAMFAAPRSRAKARAAASMGSVRSDPTTWPATPAKARAVCPPPVATSSTCVGRRARPQATSRSRSSPVACSGLVTYAAALGPNWSRMRRPWPSLTAWLCRVRRGGGTGSPDRAGRGRTAARPRRAASRDRPWGCPGAGRRSTSRPAGSELHPPSLSPTLWAERVTAPPTAPLLVLALVLRLPLLVEVLDPGDVLDDRPRRPGGSPHGVVQGLADLVLGGAGLLRSREASRHSGGAAGGRHRRQRDQFLRLGVERPFPIKDPGEFLHRSHRVASVRGEIWLPGHYIWGPPLVWGG